MIRRFIITLLLVISGMSSAQEATPQPANGTVVVVHVVQRGENLFRIALSYGITVEQLAAHNNIADPGSIQVGQRLLIPPTGAAIPNPTAISPAPTQSTHVVQPGESLRSIAAAYGMTLEELIAVNGISNPDLVYVGQVLFVTPLASPAAPVLPAPTSSVVHVVQSGETLFRIATAYGVSVVDLAAANGISDPTLIYAGQQLLIPASQAPQAALDLPAPITALDVTPRMLVEGQTVRLRVTTAVAAIVTGSFLGLVVQAGSEATGLQHTLFMPIAIYTEPNVYPLVITVVDAAGTVVTLPINLQVMGGGYSSERLTLPDSLLPLLDPAVEDNELAIMRTLMSIFSPENYMDRPMSLAAAAAVTSPFGTRRSYNGSGFDRFHSGVDFAGASGTPVLAAAAGRVVLADALNIRGVTTIIDHGWGIYTVYSHQAERYVDLGSLVISGQQIGTIGATGRTTGAHLHWEVWVNGVPVDGLQWVRQGFP